MGHRARLTTFFTSLAIGASGGFFAGNAIYPAGELSDTPLQDDPAKRAVVLQQIEDGIQNAQVSNDAYFQAKNELNTLVTDGSNYAEKSQELQKKMREFSWQNMTESSPSYDLLHLSPYISEADYARLKPLWEQTEISGDYDLASRSSDLAEFRDDALQLVQRSDDAPVDPTIRSAATQDQMTLIHMMTATAPFRLSLVGMAFAAMLDVLLFGTKTGQKIARRLRLDEPKIEN